MAEQTQEQQANCKGCGKPIKKVRRYYLNGIYYCTRGCFRKAQSKAAAKEEK